MTTDSIYSNYATMYSEWNEAYEEECRDCKGTGMDRDEIYECETCYGEGIIVYYELRDNP